MKTNLSTMTIGLDLGARRHDDGKIFKQRTIANSRRMLERVSESCPGALMAKIGEAGHPPAAARSSFSLMVSSGLVLGVGRQGPPGPHGPFRCYK